MWYKLCPPHVPRQAKKEETEASVRESTLAIHDERQAVEVSEKSE